MIRSLFLFLFFVSCTAFFIPHRPNAKDTQWFSQTSKIRVVSTTRMIGDVVEKIAGNNIIHKVLMDGDIDPHSYEIVKGDFEYLQSADIVFYNGLGLENGMQLRSFLEKSESAVSVGEYIQNSNPALLLASKRCVDPHIWTDVSLWSKIVPCITQEIIKLVPMKSSELYENQRALINKLDRLHTRITSKFLEIPDKKRYLVSSHDAFSYFTRAYLSSYSDDWSKRCAAPEGLAPDSQVSYKDLDEIARYILENDVSVLFPESNVNMHALNKLKEIVQLQGKEIQCVDTPLLGDTMGSDLLVIDSYESMMEHNASTIHYWISK